MEIFYTYIQTRVIQIIVEAQDSVTTTNVICTILLRAAYNLNKHTMIDSIARMEKNLEMRNQLRALSVCIIKEAFEPVRLDIRLSVREVLIYSKIFTACSLDTKTHYCEQNIYLQIQIMYKLYRFGRIANNVRIVGMHIQNYPKHRYFFE